MEKELNEQERLAKKFNDMNAWQKERSFWINRIPPDVKTEFMKLAREEFEEDYGMTIKWLLDFRSGLLSSPNEQISVKLDLLADELVVLKSRFDILEKSKDKKDDFVIMADGTKKQVK